MDAFKRTIDRTLHREGFEESMRTVVDYIDIARTMFGNTEEFREAVKYIPGFDVIYQALKDTSLDLNIVGGLNLFILQNKL